jgi:hypothetical protein
METSGKTGVLSEKQRRSIDRRVSVAPMMDWQDSWTSPKRRKDLRIFGGRVFHFVPAKKTVSKPCDTKDTTKIPNARRFLLLLLLWPSARSSRHPALMLLMSEGCATALVWVSGVPIRWSGD